MRSIITTSIPTRLKEKIDTIAEQQATTRSTIFQRALEEFLIDCELDAVRTSLVPEAQKRGLYTDEDVFKLVS